jgi:hypothetical protein
LALAALLVLEAVTVFRLVTLYQAGSQLMHQIVAEGTEAGVGSRLLFINVPDRFEYKAPLYPLGHWGMLLAPVSQDLSDFVSFSSGVPLVTQSLSDFPLLAGPLAASPYRVNTRGSDAHGSAELYELTRWANIVFVTHYAPDGRLWLSEAGDIEPGRAAQPFVADFSGVARLLRATASAQTDGTIPVRLEWQALSPAQAHDTVFVHLFDAQDQLVAQADGDSLGGLIPLAAWRSGDLIRELRVISPEAALPPGAYRLRVGVYNRVSGERYPAHSADGTAWPEGSALAANVLVPPP